MRKKCAKNSVKKVNATALREANEILKKAAAVFAQTEPR
jgi:hypothetical protein